MKNTLVLYSSLLLAGCAQTDRLPLPAVELSAHWRTGPTAESNGASWWKTFGDATLDALESLALAENLDIQQAQARLQQARSAAGMAEASLAPSIDLEASAGRAQQT